MENVEFERHVRAWMPRMFRHPVARAEADRLILPLLAPQTLAPKYRVRGEDLEIKEEIYAATGAAPEHLMLMSNVDLSNMGRSLVGKPLGIFLWERFGNAIAAKTEFKLNEIFLMSSTEFGPQQALVWYYMAVVAMKDRERQAQLGPIVERASKALVLGASAQNRKSWVVMTGE